MEKFELKKGMKIETIKYGSFKFESYIQGVGQKMVLTNEGAELTLNEIDWEKTSKVN